MTFAIWVIANVLIGSALGFWHRSLMVRLHTNHPEIWSQLGGWFFPGDQWSLSLRLPCWSWKSFLFLSPGNMSDLVIGLFV
jgi:hypothetical protein